jgi:hypothetical protein
MKIRLLLITLFSFCIAACYEVNEEIVINENGTGTFATKTDMSSLLDMMGSFMGDEELAKGGLDRAVDTTIMMGDVLDSAKDVTAEQRKLLENGKMHLVMNLKEKVFKMDMDFAFNDYKSLEALLSGVGAGNLGTRNIENAFSSIFDKNDTAKQSQPEAPKGPELGDLNGVYDVTVKNGLISKKLNADKLKAVLERPEMAQMKQLTSSGMEILYTTSIKLPRPVKKSDNALVKLSDDKRTATIKYNLLEIFDNPEKFSYTIEY